MTVRVAGPDPSEVETGTGEAPGDAETVEAQAVEDQSVEAQAVEATAGELAAPSSRHPFVAGALGATWAFCVGVGLMAVLVMLFWAISPNTVGDSGAAWRAVGLTWLGAQLVPLSVSGLPVTVLPLAAVLPALLLTRRGGGWSARLVANADAHEVRALIGGAAVTYGAAGAVVAWLCSTGTTGAKPAQAFLCTAAVCAAGTLWGVGREIDLVGRVRARVSAETWLTLVAGWTALVCLFALGVGLVVLGLIAGFGDAVANLASLQGGLVAGLGMTLLGLLTVPTLAVWAVALAAGPGFAVGSLGSASAFGGSISALPALPVLAAIPSSVPAWAPVLLLGPVACGAMAGRIRWREDLPTWPGAILAALAVGAVVAPGVALAVLLTSGSLGGGRLERIGPELGPVTAAVVGLVVLGFLIDAALQTAWLAWELREGEARGDTAAESPSDPERTGPDAQLTDAAPAPAATEPTAGPAGPSDAAQSPAAPSTAAKSTAAPSTTGSRTSLATAITGLGSAARGSALWAAGQASSAAGALTRRAAPQPEPDPAEPQASADTEAEESLDSEALDPVTVEEPAAEVPDASEEASPSEEQSPSEEPSPAEPLPAWMDETAELDLSALRPTGSPADPAPGPPTDPSGEDK